MESHYLTALFPPEHITHPSLYLSFSASVPPTPTTYCLSLENRMERGWCSGPNQDGAAGASVSICSLGHTLYKQMSPCLPPFRDL